MIIKAHSNKTELKNRTLWYDGDSTFHSSNIMEHMKNGQMTGMFVDEITTDIAKFNQLVKPEERLLIKSLINPLNFDWNIPEEHMAFNLIDYFIGKLEMETKGMSYTHKDVRDKRVAAELQLYNQLGLENVLRVIIYIINTLDSKNVVWGVGRGSSVSSYILYLIGVHDVDSILYDLDVTDFLRE